MSRDLQVKTLLATAMRTERATRAAVVRAEQAMNIAAIEVAERITSNRRLGDAGDEYLARRSEWKLAVRAWRNAKSVLEVANARQAS